VQIDGEQRRLARASKITRREFPWCRPLNHEIEMEDTSGRIYRLTGKVIAQSCWAGWPNANVWLGLVEWHLDGKTGYGETQEVQWNDYIWRFGQETKS
jgi:hypothetical protein